MARRPDLPARAGESHWGPDHHLHVKTHLGHGANWGLFAEDLPDEANHITLSKSVTDSSGIPAPEVHYTMADNARLPNTEIVVVSLGPDRGITRPCSRVVHRE